MKFGLNFGLLSGGFGGDGGTTPPSIDKWIDASNVDWVDENGQVWQTN